MKAKVFRGLIPWALVSSEAPPNVSLMLAVLLAIKALFKEWRHYLEGNPKRLEFVVYTNHCNLKSFMTPKSNYPKTSAVVREISNL